MGVLRHSLAAAGAVALAPAAALAIALQPGWRIGWRERLGAVPPVTAGGIWVHGASVGEALAAARLVGQLQELGYSIYASAATHTGRQVLREKLSGVSCGLAPIDHPWCVDRALARVRPELLAMVETELWPSWIAAATRQGIPVTVVSGRISDRTFPRYLRVARLLAPTLRRLVAVGARSELDAERFVAIGVPEERVRVTGDLKLAVGANVPAPAPDLADCLAARPLLVAGSTHPGEERAVAEALARCEARGVEAVAVVAPRHLRRLREVQSELADAGRQVRLRSELGSRPLVPGEVLVLDTVGELPAVYALASAAFVGGSLVPVGGHNLLEPVFAGCPVVFGPHTENVREGAALLEATGAGRRVDGAQQLAEAWLGLLSEVEDTRQRVADCRAALQTHRDTAARSAELLVKVLSSRVPASRTRAGSPERS